MMSPLPEHCRPCALREGASTAAPRKNPITVENLIPFFINSISPLTIGATESRAHLLKKNRQSCYQAHWLATVKHTTHLRLCGGGLAQILPLWGVSFIPKFSSAVS